MWHVHAEKSGNMLQKVLRQPNEIFYRADSMRDPYGALHWIQVHC